MQKIQKWLLSLSYLVSKRAKYFVKENATALLYAGNFVNRLQ